MVIHRALAAPQLQRALARRQASESQDQALALARTEGGPDVGDAAFDQRPDVQGRPDQQGRFGAVREFARAEHKALESAPGRQRELDSHHRLKSVRQPEQAPAAGAQVVGLGDVLPGYQGRIRIAPRGAEIAAFRQRLRGVRDERRMNRDHLPVFTGAERVGPQHGDSFDRKFTQCTDPVAEKAVEAHTVKVNRYPHEIVFSYPNVLRQYHHPLPLMATTKHEQTPVPTRRQTVSLSLFHRPGTVVFLDDDPDYLEMLALVLPRHWHIKLFLRPVECINYLQQEPPFWEADAWNQQQLIDHWREGKRLIPQILGYWSQYTERYALTRVCVVDYSMPGMDGLQALGELVDWPGSRVLLTGQADEQVAVRAFNRGLIDQFIAKQTPDISRRLIEAVEHLLATPNARHAQTWRVTLS